LRRRQLSTVWNPGGVARNSLLMSVRVIVRFAVGIVLLPLLVHRIGTDATGLFLFATTLTGYFTAVELSLATSLTKYVAEYRAEGRADALNSAVRTTTMLMLLVGVVIAAGLGVFAAVGASSLFHEPAVHNQASTTLAVAAVAALFYWPSRVGPAALEGLERFDQSASLSIAASVATIAGVVAITATTHSVAVLVAFTTAVLVVQNVVSGVLAWPHLGLRRGLGRWVGAHLRPLLGFGGALFVIGIADTLTYAFDRAIVAGFVGTSAIVVYEVAVRIQSGVRTVSSLAGGALLPAASRLIAQGRGERLRELVLVGSFLGVVVATPVAVAAMVLSKPLIVAWVGSSYGQYASYAQIFVSFWIVNSNTSVLGSIVAGVGRLGAFAAIAFVGSAVSLALSVVLTWRFGTIGVILGTVIPTWVAFPLWLVLALRRVGVPVRDYVRDVGMPAYGLLAVWAPLLVLFAVAAPPHGLAETGAAGVIGVAVYWAAALPLVRSRWRRATEPAVSGPVATR
jgi:O-antigen/teichoic acid export membrane protein